MKYSTRTWGFIIEHRPRSVPSSRPPHLDITLGEHTCPKTMIHSLTISRRNTPAVRVYFATAHIEPAVWPNAYWRSNRLPRPVFISALHGWIFELTFISHYGGADQGKKGNDRKIRGRRHSWLLAGWDFQNCRKYKICLSINYVFIKWTHSRCRGKMANRPL